MIIDCFYGIMILYRIKMIVQNSVEDEQNEIETNKENKKQTLRFW